MNKVYCVQDNDCHWYVIPFEMKDDFFNDLENATDDVFIEKYSEYMTGGDLNNVQLYAEL